MLHCHSYQRMIESFRPGHSTFEEVEVVKKGDVMARMQCSGRNKFDDGTIQNSLLE